MDCVPLVQWVKHHKDPSYLIWNNDWDRLLHNKDFKELEQYLISFCLSTLDLGEQNQVLIVRTTFISIITNVLRMQRDKNVLQPQTLNEAYQLIHEIESWNNLSEFILGVTYFLNTIIHKISINTLTDQTTNPRLKMALQLINDYITSRQLTVSWLAEQIGISSAHLSNLFRLYFDINASSYIKERKVAAITYELIHTTKPLTEIRNKFGFVSHSHFTQFFKSSKKITPLKYRQQAIGQ